jgi:hypothetical protein
MVEDDQSAPVNADNVQEEGKTSYVGYIPRRVFVTFQYRQGLLRDTSRLFLDNVPDLRTAQNVMDVEKMIAERINADEVLIFNWKPLEG